VRSPEELRQIVEEHLEWIAYGDEAYDDRLGEAVRYGLSGGKRIRPILCLATGEAVGAEPPGAPLPAAAAIEFVHTFSLVHDDLPALDDDATRRGRASMHVQFGEGVALLAGDALLARAFELAVRCNTPLVVRELESATSAMIKGQVDELTGSTADLEVLYRRKTGSLFHAAVGCALWVAGVPDGEPQAPWRRFGQDFGLLFQVVDDIVDSDGIVESRGLEAAGSLAAEVEARARGALDEIDADTSVLAELLSALSARAGGR
jgi:geranylgeranyl diphosphate synthase type II